MKKLLKITMEFEDEIQWLEGEDAQKWHEEANSAVMLQTVHGQPFPEFKWKTKKRKKNK